MLCLWLICVSCVCVVFLFECGWKCVVCVWVSVNVGACAMFVCGEYLVLCEGCECVGCILCVSVCECVWRVCVFV